MRIIRLGATSSPRICKRKVLGKEIVPKEIAPLAEDASNEQKAEQEAKVQQRNKWIEEINERNNCHIALALDK